MDGTKIQLNTTSPQIISGVYTLQRHLHCDYLGFIKLVESFGISCVMHHWLEITSSHPFEHRMMCIYLNS